AKAAEEYRQALIFEPRNFEVHYRLAMTFKSLGKIHEAERELQKAVELRPDAPGPLEALGDLLVQEKNFALAVPTYRDALRVRPDDASLHERLADALAQNGDLKDAVMKVVRQRGWRPRTQATSADWENY